MQTQMFAFTNVFLMHAQMFLVLDIQTFAISRKMYLHIVTFLYETIKISICKPLVVSELRQTFCVKLLGLPLTRADSQMHIFPPPPTGNCL